MPYVILRVHTETRQRIKVLAAQRSETMDETVKAAVEALEAKPAPQAEPRDTESQATESQPAQHATAA